MFDSVVDVDPHQQIEKTIYNYSITVNVENSEKRMLDTSINMLIARANRSLLLMQEVA